MKLTLAVLPFLSLLATRALAQANATQTWIRYYTEEGCATENQIIFDVFEGNGTATCYPVCPFCADQTVGAVDVMLSTTAACLVWYDDRDCTNEVGRFEQTDVSDPSCATVPAGITVGGVA
ncbi:hypothetical protein BT69DRAFT_1282100, partial [Atractiella rhizophila]